MGRWLSARLWTGPLFGLSKVGVGDIAFAVLLSSLAVASLNGFSLSRTTFQHAGAGASFAVLLLTAPVMFARRNPVGAATVLAAGGGLNWLMFDHLIRCGSALPAVFYAAFMVGSRSRRWTHLVVGAVLIAANVVCQCYSDPELGGTSGITSIVPIAIAFVATGRLLHGRRAAVAALRRRTAELRDQREKTARLAVAADRALIVEDLDSYLHDRVAEIASAAAAGQAMLESTPDRAVDAFVEIQGAGRETLTHMRGVVGGLHTEAPTDPQPVLTQLGRLLEQVAPAEARLTVSGDPRTLPPGVELSGYRIVEHLLLALENAPMAQIEVSVAFRQDVLQLTVAGPRAGRGSSRAALAAASERTATLGGTLRTQASGGRRETVVLLPLVEAHV
jgi:hypothetical protein